MSIVKGKKLVAFVKKENSFVSIGYATNHSLSTSGSTISVSHKDLADAGQGGHWSDQELDELSWTITSENFYSNDAEGITFADLWNYYAAGTVLDLKFGVCSDSVSGVPTGGWTPSNSGLVLQGKAIISNIEVSAPVDDNASFSVQFQGKGPLSVAS